MLSMLDSGNIYSFPALSHSESANTTQAAHCLTIRPMSPCFVTTSSSYRIYNIILTQCRNEPHTCVEIEDSFTCVRRATTICHKETPSRTLLDNLTRWYQKSILIVHYLCLKVSSFAGSAVFALFEQGRLFSACGVSLQLSHRQQQDHISLLSVFLQRYLHLKHDYVATSQHTRLKLHRKPSFCYITVSYNIISGFITFSSNLAPHGPSLIKRRWNRLCQYKVASACRQSSCQMGLMGGRASKTSTAQFLSDFVEPHGQQVEIGECYHYVDHTDDIGLLAYSKATYVFADIPLRDLLTQITLSQARVVMRLHNIPCGARERPTVIQSRLEDHSGPCCDHNRSIFIKKLTKAALPVERKIKYNQKKDQSLTGTIPRPSELPFDSCPSVEFPPVPLDTTLSRHIIDQACSRMDAQNINESGCAVCGELKPLRDMSRLKAVKRQLDILSASGVSRIERKKSSHCLREYTGPILDYNCSMICNSCRRSIRTSKVPRLALANGLWIGDVPPQLKCLNFVEKILVARIRHTCAYVKVASGMRKMTANVVAFQSPVPKVYNILPPPRDDLDDVLAICILDRASQQLMI